MEKQATSFTRKDIDHYSGCLLGGAVGDALGAPIEFLSLEEIRSRYSRKGINGYIRLSTSGYAPFTDDTQLSLFTTEGLLRIAKEGIKPGDPAQLVILHRAYRRWLASQDGLDSVNLDESEKNSGLLAIPEMHRCCAPGITCLTSMRSGKLFTTQQVGNNSKGCGGVMRVAPVGLAGKLADPFTLGCDSAALTHGHPTGYLAAGVLASVIDDIINGQNLLEAINNGLKILITHPNHQEVLTAVQAALTLSQDRSTPANAETVEQLGKGWIAEEALAISLYCALVAEDDFKHGVLLAVNHGGDSDSTGAITGNILGVLLGKNAIPSAWLEKLELRPIIEEMAEQLLIHSA